MTKSAFSSFLISFAVFPLIVMWVFPQLVSSVSRRQYNQLELPSGTYGPETLVFDCDGEGPYTGVSDGRILKWHGSEVGWKDFAVTSPLRYMLVFMCMLVNIFFHGSLFALVFNLLIHLNVNNNGSFWVLNWQEYSMRMRRNCTHHIQTVFVCSFGIIFLPLSTTGEVGVHSSVKKD